MASSPAIVICTVCHMYSLSISVSDEGFTCDKCREIVRLTEKVLELETRIQTLVEDSKNVRAVDTALDVFITGLLYIPISLTWRTHNTLIHFYYSNPLKDC